MPFLCFRAKRNNVSMLWTNWPPHLSAHHRGSNPEPSFTKTRDRVCFTQGDDKAKIGQIFFARQCGMTGHGKCSRLGGGFETSIQWVPSRKLSTLPDRGPIWRDDNKTVGVTIETQHHCLVLHTLSQYRQSLIERKIVQS